MKLRRKARVELPPAAGAAADVSTGIEGVRLVPPPDKPVDPAPEAEATPGDADFSVTAAFGIERAGVAIGLEHDAEPGPVTGAEPEQVSLDVESPPVASVPPAAPPEPAAPRPPSLIITDDDLPDAVEIGEIARDPAVVKTKSKASIDPRLRRRRIAVRRAAGRRRLVVASIVAVLMLAAMGALVVLASPLFGVRDVEVTGAVYTSDAELASVLDNYDGEPVLTLDTDAVAAALEALPWVRKARVQTEFPSTMRVEISERQPVAAYVGGDANWRVIDREGRVIAIIPDGAQPVDYLAIESTGPDVPAGSPAGDIYRVAGELAMSLPPELRNVTSSITLASNGDIGLRLTSETMVSFGRPTDLRKKLTVLIELLRERDPSELAALDLADPDSPGITAA